MNLRKISFWKRWLLHSFLIWFIGNLVNFSNFLYKKNLHGDYLFHDKDGTPVTIVERFTEIFTIDGVFSLLLSVILIELNYNYFFKKKKWIFILTSLATGLAIIFVLIVTNVLKNGSVMYHLPAMLIIVPYAFAYPFLIAFIDDKIFKAERSLERSTAELNALKAQINPHFFFNTLNGIYGTALKEEAGDTALAIEKLSGMMRYILTEGSDDFVPVESELKFVSEYIKLQRMRIPENDNIQLTITINFDEQHVLVAPLLLLPLIENAFQYGISMEKESFIVLNIFVQNKHLKLYVRNSINVKSTKGTGIGIANVKRRLALLYPDRHTISISATDDVYTLQLDINL